MRRPCAILFCDLAARISKVFRRLKIAYHLLIGITRKRTCPLGGQRQAFARWPAVLRIAENPTARVRMIQTNTRSVIRAAGLSPQGLPSGIRPRRPMPRTTAQNMRGTWARTFALRQALLMGEGFTDLFRRIFGGFLSISSRSQKTSVFWGVPIVDNIPGITCIIRILGGHWCGWCRWCGGCCPLSRANFAENVQPEYLKILKWMENGWKMAWIEISKS